MSATSAQQIKRFLGVHVAVVALYGGAALWVGDGVRGLSQPVDLGISAHAPRSGAASTVSIVTPPVTFHRPAVVSTPHHSIHVQAHADMLK